MVENKEEIEEIEEDPDFEVENTTELDVVSDCLF